MNRYAKAFLRGFLRAALTVWVLHHHHAHGQSILTADGLASFGTNTVSSGGGGGGYALVFQAHKQGDVTSCTTAGATSTGATLIVVIVHEYRISTPATLTDSKGNTWSAASTATGDGQTGNAIFYCVNPTVGTGHTFSLVGGAGGGSDTTFNALHVYGFSGNSGSPLFSPSTQVNAANWSSKQPGSISDASIGLLVTAATINVSGKTLSVDSSFTGLSQGYSSAGTGNGAAYKIGSASENPTWSINSGLTDGTVSMVGFK